MASDTNSANLLAGTPGVCRFCMCTQFAPCTDPHTGEPCAWIAGSNRTACDSLPCEARYAALIAGATERPGIMP